MKVKFPEQLFSLYAQSLKVESFYKKIEKYRDDEHVKEIIKRYPDDYPKIIAYMASKHIDDVDKLRCVTCGHILSAEHLLKGNDRCEKCAGKPKASASTLFVPENFVHVDHKISIPADLKEILLTYKSKTLLYNLAHSDYRYWFIDNNVSVKTAKYFASNNEDTIVPLYCWRCHEPLPESKYILGARYCSMKCYHYGTGIPGPEQTDVFDKAVVIPEIFKQFHRQAYTASIKRVNAMKFSKLMRENGYENWLIENHVTLQLLTMSIGDGKNVIEPVHCATCGKLLTFASLHNRSTHCSLRCVQLDPKVIAKKRATTKEHYGVEHASQMDTFCYNMKERFWDKIVARLARNKVEIAQTREQFMHTREYRYRCMVCGYEWTEKHHNSQNIHCPLCVSKPYSIKELQLQKFISSVYNGPIEFNDRKVLDGKELDIYLPDLKLAFEFDGNYYHSSMFERVDALYHRRKTQQCEEKGIRLIHIFEYEWDKKQGLVENLIKNAIGLGERIYARNCQVVTITSEQYRTFLDNYHFDGKVNSSIRFGLAYNNELVAVIGFGKSRFSKTEQLELHRYCVKAGYQIIGGFAKLVKHSGVDSFFSFVDYAHFDGSGYKKIGCTQIDLTKPSYVYARGEKVLTRFEAQKHKLVEMFGDFDPNLTEVQNMAKHNYYQVFDCGNLKFEWKRPEQDKILNENIVSFDELVASNMMMSNITDNMQLDSDDDGNPVVNNQGMVHRYMEMAAEDEAKVQRQKQKKQAEREARKAAAAPKAKKTALEDFFE